ncbi:MAG: hypothetical protein IPP78_14155 [Holophagaceae bacterium]|nr:hypothetical protein [Holophagaceae bacterium]
MDREVASHPSRGLRAGCPLTILVACLVALAPVAASLRRGVPAWGLRELRDWLFASGCQAVGMEATGVLMPVFAALEGHVQMTVGNPNHTQNLGHKTDRGCEVDAGLAARPHSPKLRAQAGIPRCPGTDAVSSSAHPRGPACAMKSSGFSHVRGHLGNRAEQVFGTSGMAILESLAEDGRRGRTPKLIHHSVKKKLGMLTAALEAPLFPVPRKLLALQLKRLEVVEENIQDVEGLTQRRWPLTSSSWSC